MKIIDNLVKAALLGESVEYSNDIDESAVLDFALQNGIQPLLYYCLRQSESLEKCPELIRSVLEVEAKRQIAIDIFRLRNLQEVLQAFADQNIVPLLIKGTPLSYLYYGDASTRPRCDTDLFIRKNDLSSLETILTKLQYSRTNSVSGDLIRHQFVYSKPGPKGIGCDLDVHWKISNPILFADMFSFDELQSTSIEIPQISRYARTLSPINALLLACVHRVAHHNANERLIWLYDIHLLANQLTESDFEEFWKKTEQKQIRNICWNGLIAAKSWFNTRFSGSETELDTNHEPSAQYLRSDLQSLDLLSMNLKQLSLRYKIQLLRENLFPPANYMLQRYKVSQRFLLPGLYLHRSVVGAWKWFQQPRQK
jgi:hypothetical protein